MKTTTFLPTFVLAPNPSYSALRTNYMGHSPSSESNKSLTSQEIPRILWNLKFHHRMYKCPPPVPILIKINSFPASPSQFMKIRFNIIFPPTPGSSYPRVSPPKNLYACLLPLIHASCPIHSILHDLISRIMFDDEYRS